MGYLWGSFRVFVYRCGPPSVPQIATALALSWTSRRNAGRSVVDSVRFCRMYLTTLESLRVENGKDGPQFFLVANNGFYLNSFQSTFKPVLCVETVETVTLKISYFLIMLCSTFSHKVLDSNFFEILIIAYTCSYQSIFL